MHGSNTRNANAPIERKKWCIENDFFRDGVDAYVCRPLHEDLISTVIQKLKKLDEDAS